MEDELKRTTVMILKLWEKVPDLSLGHLISLSTSQEDLYSLSNQELVKKVATFVKIMEHQKDIRQ